MDRDSNVETADRRTWWTFAIITLGCAAYYALLNNGLWMPRNDATYYLAIARSVARGEGLVFNGAPVTLVPLGWPTALAGFMRISPSYLFLNSVTISLMAATVGVWFWILRRFARLPVVVVTLVFSVLLFDWYTAAIQLRSEALFCLLFSSALLISFQITEMKPLHWRLALLCLLCAAMVTVRWAGLVNWILVGAILLHGEFWPRLNRRWASMILTGAVVGLTFFGLRHYQAKIFPSQLVEQYERDVVQIADIETTDALDAADAQSSAAEIMDAEIADSDVEDVQSTLQPLNLETEVDIDPESSSEDVDLEPRVPAPPKAQKMEGLLTRASGAPALVPSRALEMGLWWASLFWKPTYLAITVPLVSITANLFGWVLIALYTWTAIVEARQRRWILLAALLLSLALVVRWPNLRPMYLMPMAPVLLYGIWRGVERLSKRLHRGLLRTALAGTFWAAVASMVLVNVSLFAVDAWVAHSPDYYGRYFAGRAKDLLRVVDYLQDAKVKDREVGINPRYQNLNRFVPNGFALRNLNLLVDRTILEVPARIGNRVPDQLVFSTARKMGLRYYIWRPPVSPWQLWHFHATAIQKRMTGVDEVKVNPTWVLYKITEDNVYRIPLPEPSQDLPRGVSGMMDDRRPE